MTSIVDACIIGSGVAGLSAALALQQCGFHVRIYEGDQDFIDRKQGYGLTLTYSTNGPLSKLGVLEDCIANNCPSCCHYVFSPEGDVLGYYGRELKGSDETALKNENQGGNRGNLRIPRQDLRMMLIRKLQPGTIVWGMKFQNYVEYKDYVEVSLTPKIASESSTTASDCVMVRTRVLVGADGIRSRVRRVRDEIHFFRSPAVPSAEAQTLSSLRYLQVAVIIGLSSASHPHINSRGFYVVDGENRLFTMPYVAPTQVDANSPIAQPGLTMWQLSFSGLTEEQATALRKSSPEDILQEALRRTSKWFAPVQDLIRGTLPGELWATGLYDRDPMPLLTKDSRSPAGVGGSRVTIIGDAAHPMSMFKGQGANQALADGPLLAQWLSGAGGGAGMAGGKRRRSGKSHGADSEGQVHAVHADQADTPADVQNGQEGVREASPFSRVLESQQTVFTRLRCFERDMAARTSPKVLASREAAHHLHSPAVLEDVFGIAGVRIGGKGGNDAVLARLRAAQVNAALGADLDGAMRIALAELNETDTTTGNI